MASLLLAPPTPTSPLLLIICSIKVHKFPTKLITKELQNKLSCVIIFDLQNIPPPPS